MPGPGRWQGRDPNPGLSDCKRAHSGCRGRGGAVTSPGLESEPCRSPAGCPRQVTSLASGSSSVRREPCPHLAGGLGTERTRSTAEHLAPSKYSERGSCPVSPTVPKASGLELPVCPLANGGVSETMPAREFLKFFPPRCACAFGQRQQPSL